MGMNDFGRVSICGAISMYNLQEQPAGITVTGNGHGQLSYKAALLGGGGG